MFFYLLNQMKPFPFHLRYKDIVVRKCQRYTQIWLNTHTKIKNVLNPQVIDFFLAFYCRHLICLVQHKVFSASYLLPTGTLSDHAFIKINGGTNHFFVLFHVPIGHCTHWYWYSLKVVLHMSYDDIYLVFNLLTENFEISWILMQIHVSNQVTWEKYYMLMVHSHCVSVFRFWSQKFWNPIYHGTWWFTYSFKYNCFRLFKKSCKPWTQPNMMTAAWYCSAGWGTCSVMEWISCSCCLGSAELLYAKWWMLSGLLYYLSGFRVPDNL